MKKIEKLIPWGIQILLAALFFMSAMPKLTSDAETVANFSRWGMPENIYLVIGTFELLGAFGLLVPRLAGLASIGLIVIMSGALFTHLTHNEIGMAFVPLTIILLLGVLIYLRNPMMILNKGGLQEGR